jgi:hypothetical protein
MSKFDQILKEAEVEVNNPSLSLVQNAIKSAPSNVQSILNTTFNKLGTQSGENHDILVKISDIINDKTPSKFSDLDDATKTKALDLLDKAGVPIKKPNTTIVSGEPETPASPTSTTPAPQNMSTTKIPTTVPGAVV